MSLPKINALFVTLGFFVAASTAHAQIVSYTNPGPSATQAPAPMQRVMINGGKDYVYATMGGIEECKTTYSPANQNAMFYRRQNGGTVDLKIIDNVSGITQTVPVGAPGDAFLAASDLGSNFARTYLETIKRIYYTTDSGTSWYTLNLPTDPGYSTNIGVEWPYQMFFGPDGALYVFYFTENPSLPYTNRGQLNLYKVPRTTSGIPAGQHYVIDTFDGATFNRFISAVPMASHIAVVYFPGDVWVAADWSSFVMPRWYTLAWGLNPINQGNHGWIGVDETTTGTSMMTNGRKVWLATDGGALYALSSRTAASYEHFVQKLPLTNGTFPDSGLGAPGYPLMDLAAVPGTDINSYLGNMQFAGTLIGPVMFFDAMRFTDPLKWGTKGPNVVYLAKDGFGYAELKDYHVLNVKNPASGNVTWAKIKNDVTSKMLPPGHIQAIGMGSGWDHSVTGIIGALVYTFCRGVTNGNQVEFHTTDISN